MYGIPGYDHLLPDDSEAGQQAWRAEADGFVREADAIDRGTLSPADAVTLDCTRGAAAQEVAVVDLAADDHTVTAMHYEGPAAFLAVAARTILLDQAAAEDFLTRVQGSGVWLDQVTDQLRAGERAGRLPVAPAGGECHRLGRGDPGQPRQQPRPRPPAAAGLVPRGGLGSGPPGGGGGCRATRPWPGGWPRSGTCCRGRGRPSTRDCTGYPTGTATTPRPSASTPRCRCRPRTCTRPGSTTSRRWRPAPRSSAPGWACPGGTRSSPRYGRRPGRSLPRRRSAGRWPPCGGPRRRHRNSSPPRSRRPAR